MDHSAIRAAKRTDVLCFSIEKQFLSSMKLNPNCLFSSSKYPLGMISLFLCTAPCSLTPKSQTASLSPFIPLNFLFFKNQTKLLCFLKIHLWNSKLQPHYHLPVFQMQFCNINRLRPAQMIFSSDR